MRTALLFFAFIFLFLQQTLGQETPLEIKYMVGPTLTTPVGIVVDEAGNLFVANSYQARVLDANGDFKKDITFEDPPAAGKARAIAKDKQGNIYIWDSLKMILYKSDKEGNMLFKFRNTYTGTYHSSSVEGIAVAPDGSIYITDVNQHVVRKFSGDGQFLHELNGLKTPIDVAVGADGNVFVADSHHSRVVKFSSSGQLVTTYATPGNVTSGFNMPTGIEVGENGMLYVADAGTRTVHAFHENGEQRMSIMLPGIGQGVNMGIGLDDAGNIYVTGSGSLSLQPQGGKIMKLSPGGEILAEYGSPQAATDRLILTALETDSAGHYFYAGDWLTRKVHVFNRQGIKLSQFGSNGPGSEFNSIQDIASGTDGFVYVLDSLREGRVRKYSVAGNFISDFDAIPEQGTSAQHRHKLTLGLDHHFYVLEEGKVVKYNKLGKFLSVVELSDSLTYNTVPTYQDIAVDAAGNFYVIILENRYESGLNAVYHVNKYAASGEIMTKFATRGRTMGGENIPKSIEIDRRGNIYIAGTTVDVFDTEGALIGNVAVLGDDVSVSPDGSHMLVGKTHGEHFYILGNTSVSDNQSSYISGTIYHDANLDGNLDSNESRLKDILVRAEPGSVFGKTDVFGNYKIAVDAIGTYEVSQVLPKKEGIEIAQTSPEDNRPHTVTISENKTTVPGINFGNQVTLSPLLTVSVSSDRRRRCFESTTKLTYSNTGFAPAENVKVYLQLPEQVELLSADKPYTRLPNGTYVFEAGTVAAGQRSVITIQDKVVCGDESIRGMTVCTKVWITPGNQSPTAPPAPVITITGTCNPETGKVRFVIKNIGQVDMEESEQFRKYINGLLSTVEDYRLAAGDSLVLWVPAGGRTVRLEADQPDGNGDNTMASTTVEACSAVATPTAFSTGFVNALPTDDEEAEVAEECLPIIDSFDPNDKLVTPVGRTEENYTPTGVALKYKIRFQNTGTDVAYRVVVVDTLSEHLDLSTLQIGSASHTYRYELSGKGKPVLTWTFDNIMLPDSTSNEPGSHGYIQFSIKPKADLPEKTAVENYADIFFDFNSPVRTNITVNRIYDMPLIVDESVRLNLEQIIATPSITSFAPAAGKQGTEVTLNGKRFSTTASNKVYFNGILAPVVSASETELRVLVPTGAATGLVKVMTPDGAANTADAFEVFQPPVLSSFSPAEGIAGSTVTLQGEQLNPGLLQSIKLGTKECDIISNTGDMLLVRVPAEALTSKFKIVTKGGESESTTEYVVWHQPSISSLSKTTDAVGTTLLILGEHFAPVADRNKVLFGQAQAEVLQATATQLTVKVPAGAASGFITVETPGGKATSAASFEVIPGPVFVALSPSKGSVGTEVELTGAHFGMLGVLDEIHFNGEKALVLEASDASYKVRVPRGATSGKVTITGYGGVAYSTTDFVVEELTPTLAIAVYPNPTTGHFTISFQHADFDVQAVQVFSTVGKLIHTATLSSPQPEKLEMNLTFAHSGLYILHIRTDRGIVIKKLTVL